MSLTSKGAALLAFVALVGEVLASYGWLGLHTGSAAAFLVIFVGAGIVFALGLGLPKAVKGGSGVLREVPPLQGWQIIEERTVRHERRVLVGDTAREEWRLLMVQRHREAVGTGDRGLLDRMALDAAEFNRHE